MARESRFDGGEGVDGRAVGVEDQQAFPGFVHGINHTGGDVTGV
jgi:hypothetical protein